MLRILIVDDAEVIRSLFRLYLSGLEFECSAAADGQEAVELFADRLARGCPFDCVTMDLDMPRMNGGQAIQEIRRLEREAGTPPEAGARIIVITSKASQAQVEEDLTGCQIDACLLKPVMKNQLLSRIYMAAGARWGPPTAARPGPDGPATS